ncbi:MAG: hypothetical protein NC182_07480 [Prevotella sp.]|nr:hypothetical protein [Staphylococcus sp.]MCM1351024.1 hypothetical protein [Prevotella sp.]
MKVYVYTPLNDCFQIKEVSIKKNYTFYYGDYNIDDTENFIIKDVLNSIAFRIFYNLSVIAGISLGCDDNSFERLRKERKTFINKNKNIIGCIFPSLFHLKGEIEFKPINCNENTILKIFRTKGKFPFYYEIQNGKVEVVYNGKKRKKSNH